ncbi:Helicase, C-terminal domain and P-loop containing nucleoside triphosphate hydrolase domain-containing protein [Strongyloides ratti]|uniref:Helicase, C-terminal domain and P-loop containing nucleoside triphosphate hydrolase domain-containing protein n=1 Tax=Strongyloides ratti TaxID=34506 RepID=A0A090KRC6_STRRB|nr:Helicase, C-terminal domain and P-loop containing nucleoside triphosphate hydrolase domain-containing protein [Strongyloides ratti]CEF60064.1 Helicase, C-terminal domain and P-loop containing nucleoside triphosphate hydrolase domain-containing protein [Strongyloides ratti]
MPADEKTKLLRLAMEHPEKFSEENNVILITPDSMIGENLRLILSSLYKKNLLKKVIIDEAHLIFDQGLGFRPNYLKIGSVSDEAVRRIIRISHFLPHTVIRGISYKQNIVITMKKKENLLDISDYSDSLIRLRILRKLCYENKLFRVVIIYSSTLSKEEKTQPREIYEKSNYSVFITTAENLVGVDLKTCSVLLHHGLPTNISTYFQDIERLNRSGDLAFSLVYSTSSAISSLKKILTVENFNISCRRSVSVSSFSECSTATSSA